VPAMYHALISGELGCYKYACVELRSWSCTDWIAIMVA